MPGRGIVLHAIAYSDRSDIVHLYTDDRGRIASPVSYSRGRRNVLSRGLFIPLSVLEIEFAKHSSRNLYRMEECRLSFPTPMLSIHPVKNAISLFMAELLYRILQEGQRDEPLFEYLSGSVHFLEHTGKGIENFPLVFLLGLLHYLGIYPDRKTYRQGYYFDMVNGIFIGLIPGHPDYLSQDESNHLSKLLRLSYEDMELDSFSLDARVQLLGDILRYYRLHLPSFPKLRSLSVMQSFGLG
ncbi:MAG: DNA repair protein RecO C-terminal domain-containing protein [Tannerellaceae bacterium]|jgi:DNA repair protein RecO (recombination protein O)|nr:DNA repair protein RecO C-terminal domain-containing protein [Tannerellaceae bacterium]